MKKSMRKGFTLVELLIVIVVIGILSAMMMLSSTEAVSSARAADIISDMRNMKTALLAWYADNLSTVEANDGELKTYATTNSPDILKYLGTDKVAGSYSFEEGATKTEWYIGCTVSDPKVQGKLASRAGTVGLLKSKVSNDTYVAGNTTVYLFAH